MDGNSSSLTLLHHMPLGRSLVLSTERCQVLGRVHGGGWRGERMHLYSEMESFSPSQPDPFPQRPGEMGHPPPSSNGPSLEKASSFGKERQTPQPAWGWQKASWKSCAGSGEMNGSKDWEINPLASQAHSSHFSLAIQLQEGLIFLSTNRD